jgi:hypothetical protein
MCFLRSTRVFGWLDPNTNSETADALLEITPPNNRPDYAQPILKSLLCQLCSPTHSAPLWQTLSFFRRSPILFKIHPARILAKTVILPPAPPLRYHYPLF